MKLAPVLLILAVTPALADVCPVAESVPHQMIVKMRDGPVSTHDRVVLHRFASGAELWRTDADLVSLQLDPAIEYAEPDYVVYADVVPNDPRWGTGGSYGLTIIDAPHAWDVTTGDPSVVVGIVDTGSGPHADLSLVPGYDYLNNDADASDDHRHGTFTASQVGGVGNNGIGFVGVAWHVSLKPYKFLSGCGSGTTSNAILAIDDATASGVPILNNSWGGSGFSQALLDSINAYCAAGGLFVASAGNNASDTDLTPQYPADYDSPCIISVAATDSLDGLASFSNFGALTVDLGAPGVSILGGIPYPYTCSGTTSSDYGFLSGTSMAAPFVSGVAALVKSLCPTCTGADIKARILAAVDPVASLAGRTVTGGRLNAARAVGYGGPPPPPPAAFCNDGTCDPAESCKDCPSDCGLFIHKPRSAASCCGDNKLQPGDLTRCFGNY